MAPTDEYDSEEVDKDEEEEEEEEDEEDEDDEDEEEDEEEEEDEAPPPKKKKAAAKKGKDPNRPKRNVSAFLLYSQAKRSQVKEENPDASFGNIARILAGKYRNLSSEEKKPWEKKALKDKKRYQNEMKEYEPPEEYAEPSGKKAKKEKDPRAPKRNVSAYFLYSIDIRPTVREENPSASFGEIAKLISARYKALASKERSKWEKKAAEDKKRYEREMKAYKAMIAEEEEDASD